MLPDEIVHAYKLIDEDPDIFIHQSCSHGNFLELFENEYQEPQDEQPKTPVAATEKDAALQKSVEEILLSIFDGDGKSISLIKKEINRAKNRASAQKSRDADKLFTELMFLELKEALKTLGMYDMYIAKLKMHGSRSIEGLYELEQRHSTHKANVALLQAYEFEEKAESISTESTESVKERNRRHAQKSRMKRNKFMEDLTSERDKVVMTLKEVVNYTSALESSCSFLNDLSEEMNASLMELRQNLFDRTCVHYDKHRQLESRMTFRVAYRLNFR